MSALRASAPATLTMWSRASSAEGHRSAKATVVRDGALYERADGGIVQRLQGEQHGARQQRADHGERRVLGGGGHERNPPILDRGEQHILLGLGEAVHLVDEHHGLGLAGRHAALGILDYRAHVLDAGVDGAELDEPAVARDEVGQGGLAGAWRAPQHHGRGGGGVGDQALERAAFAQQVVLADDLG